MNRIAQSGGNALMNLGAGFLTGAIVGQAFNPDIAPSYFLVAFIGLGLLLVGFILTFVEEDWSL